MTKGTLFAEGEWQTVRKEQKFQRKEKRRQEEAAAAAAAALAVPQQPVVAPLTSTYPSIPNTAKGSCTHLQYNR